MPGGGDTEECCRDNHLTLKPAKQSSPYLTREPFLQSWPLYDDPGVNMSALNQVVLTDADQRVENNLDWSDIEWRETELPNAVVANAQTQTEQLLTSEAEAQTSHAVVMHIDLERTPSRLRHGAVMEAEGLGGPLLQFDRQALGRISTSPTLRRIRSSRRSQPGVWMESTQEEPGAAPRDPQPPAGPVSPGPRHMVSPLAPSPLCDGAVQLENGAGSSTSSSTGRQRTRSQRSKTFEDRTSCPREGSPGGTSCPREGSPGGTCWSREGSPGQHPTDFEFPCHKGQEQEPDRTRLQERRRSSVVVSIPGLDVSPGDLFVSNGSADRLNGSALSDTKKSKWPFVRRSTTKGKISISTVSTIENHLSSAHIQDWRNTEFQKYKSWCLAEFLQDQSPQLERPPAPQGTRRLEGLWELFTSEAVYFLDQLMVLKEVFLATLENLQARHCLVDLDPWRLFANINELCLVSFGFLKSLLRVVKDTWELPPEGGGACLPELLSQAFQERVCHCLQKYCLNYSAALQYLDCLKAREDFGCYLKWCERKEQCRRLQLRDLLVAPMQRLTRYPLLLRNMAKRSAGAEGAALQAVAEQVDTSICNLEGEVKWLDNYQQVKQLRDALVWLPVWERDKRAFVPESLKHLLKTVTLDNLINHRSLLHDGKLIATENTKMVDVYLFLFDEFLLITKIKRNKKRSAALEQAQSPDLDQLLKEGCTFTVVDQPVSLDRLHMKNIDQLNATASGLPHSFILMHQSRYQQCMGAFILQAPCDAVKKAWMSKIEGAVTALLKLDSQQPRVKNASRWLESSQI
ncbi:pleckstrin homology domain-containing family G member 7 isoform X1 [Gadus macrocephalus]|uniref:pleckstrin homology domain-containing family G member 7 isoform X1 n=2 Tax=Gadus macrocephalus TaxID=80720 RepID=UPI0028CBBF20|nr:pleckstrin homology domain-containing family G member 7 isoform X1 [Gadus macrocephalus]